MVADRIFTRRARTHGRTDTPDGGDLQKALPTLKVQKTALDEAEAKFERLVERGDDNQVMEQVNLVEAARADLNKTRTLMLLGMRKVLTRDQWARFTACTRPRRTHPPKDPSARSKDFILFTGMPM